MFWGFLSGRYFRPKREERIFMFIDLKSSTTIAERLGEEQYFNFLNDTFTVATPGILARQGEIYKYVGDEIIVSWKKHAGLANANCIKCYFDVAGLLKSQSEYFQREYGVQPLFKAGLHLGNVIAGEVGIIKREIGYSGDVLNTTARIQSLCNEKKVEILVSQNLIDAMDLEWIKNRIKLIGEVSLRGKTQKLDLVTIEALD